MKVGQTVFYVENHEVRIGTMVYNNNSVITIRKPTGRMTKKKMSVVADCLSAELIDYRRTKCK